MEPLPHSDPYAGQLLRIKQSILERYPRDRTERIGLLEQAFADAEFHHRGQHRKSGEPVIIHPFRVALLVAEAGLDVEAVIVALLHDIIEDTEVTKREIRQRYGDWLADIVDGLTKVPRLRGQDSRSAMALETYRKLLISTTRDIRTLLVKIFDRLDNMRDLSFLDRSRQRRIGTETLTVYVPLAQRMGLQDIADELTTLCFRFLYPKRFNAVLDRIKQCMLLERKHANGIRTILASGLDDFGLSGFVVEPRFMQVADAIFTRREPEKALARFQVTVPTSQDCYLALGALHTTCRAVPNSIRDYVSNPKPNRYQGLLTELFVGGEAVRIEITSREMEAINRKGILARWHGPYQELTRYYQNYLELLDQLDETDDLRMEDVLRYAQMESLQTFTPKGERLNLPQGSTVLDFAFAIHSDLGLQCNGALIDGRRVSRFTELRDGDMVEVLTAPAVEPAPHWLEAVRTTRAKIALRRAVRAQSLRRAEEVGRELFRSELQRLDADPEAVVGGQAFARALEERKLSPAQFFQQIGTRKLNLRPFLKETRLVEPGRVKRREAWERSLLTRYLWPVFRSPDPDLKVRRTEDAFIQMARCCAPLHGDPVTGVQKEHAITIHRSGCPMLEQVDPDSLITVGWDPEPERRAYQFDVEVEDKAGVIYRIGKVMAGLHVNIRHLKTRHDNGAASLLIDIEPVSSKTYHKIIARLRALKEVKRVS